MNAPGQSAKDQPWRLLNKVDTSSSALEDAGMQALIGEFA